MSLSITNDDCQYGTIELAKIESASVEVPELKVVPNPRNNDFVGRMRNRAVNNPVLVFLFGFLSFLLIFVWYDYSTVPTPPLLGISGPPALIAGGNCQGTIYGSALQWCPAGSWGNGACYFPASENCENGFTCSKDKEICPPGRLAQIPSCFTTYTFTATCGYVDNSCDQGQVQCNTANCTCCPTGSRCWDMHSHHVANSN